MILFLQDWLKYPNSIIHYDTKNESFLRLAEILYKMGIKNNAFFLALTQPELKDIDPHSENLDNDIKIKIAYECKINFWYFIREVLRIKPPSSITPIMFKCNRGNIALYWLFFNHITTLYVVMRQTGKTVSIMSLVTYLLNFGPPNLSINFLTKSETLKAETLKKVEELFDELPDYLNFSNKKKDIFNSEEVYITRLNNSLKGHLSSSSPKQAEKVGRGFTSPIAIIDEAAFINNVSIAMSAMLMAGNAAREFARVHNTPYGTILATTAGDIDDKDGRFIYQIFQSSMQWDESLYDCQNQEELYSTVLRNCNPISGTIRQPVVSIYLSYRQLGYDDEWLKRRLEENISTLENIERDIYNRWTSGTSRSPIPKEYLETLNRTRVINPPYNEIYKPYNYILKWYIGKEEIEKRINENIWFVGGIDTSDAIGRDEIAIVLRDHTTGEIVMTTSFNDTNLITVADFLAHFIYNYRNIVFIIERRSSGQAIIDYLIHKLTLYDINPFKRLYNSIFQEKENYKEEFKEIYYMRYFDEEVFNKYKKHIGFVTSGRGVNARSELYSSTLINMLKYTSDITYDSKLIDQISSLVVKNNRIDHQEGFKDDLVIASLLSYWFLTNSKNVDLYGIPKDTILRYNKSYLMEKFNIEVDTEDELAYEDELKNTEKRINSLIEEYKKEKDEIILRQIELRIKSILKKSKFRQLELSIDQMLENIKREKRFKNRYYPLSY